MFKNLPIRLKMVAIYLNMTIFTIPLLLILYNSMAGLVRGQESIRDAVSQEAAIVSQAETEDAFGKSLVLADSTIAEGHGLLRFYLIFLPAYIVVYLLVTVAIGRGLTKAIAFPAQKLASAAKKLAEGDVDVTIDHRSGDEMGILADEFREMTSGIKKQADILIEIAEGDYTGSIELRSERDAVNRAIREMLEHNNHMISEIREASSQVATGSAQIAGGAQGLASGTTEQAATLEELSSSAAEILSQSETNAKNASDALADMERAGELMTESLSSMRHLTESMQGITKSSEDIARVIKVIDDIAFQTNILALNAAVEAARAGQHGKGFAVVAEEVRNLASKSAAAAAETTGLIEESIRRVREGNSITVKTNESITKVSEIASANAEAMGLISEASTRQTTSISQITTGISQISTVVQANSAAAEESAAASEEMSSQAQILRSIVSHFKLLEDSGVRPDMRLPSGSVAAPSDAKY
ncbi:methyl-accepting chemotaxis protein [Oscillospiraceae bacterium OttesenSCG-928-G22]|nr:methyl-accepting chemotaxis protein [Oscillospiraceae bacterium OttesenSCG-928-G22]